MDKLNKKQITVCFFNFSFYINRKYSDIGGGGC